MTGRVVLRRYVRGPGNGGDVLPVGVGARLRPPAAWTSFGVVGAGRMWDDEGELGLGGMTGDRDRLPVPAAASASSFLWTAGTTTGDSRAASDSLPTQDGRAAGCCTYFPGARVRAYVGGTVGAMRVERRSEFPDQCGFDAGGQFSCPAVSTFEREISSGSFGAVTGVRISLTDRVFVRPEFEFAKAGEFITLGGAVGVGWGW